MEALRAKVAKELLVSLLDGPHNAERGGIAEAARIISSTLDIGQVYQQFVDEVRKLADFDRATINLIDEVRGKVMIAQVSGLTVSSLSQGEALPLAGC